MGFLEFPDWAIAFIIVSTALPLITVFLHTFCRICCDDGDDDMFSCGKIASLHWYIGKEIRCIKGANSKCILDFSCSLVKLSYVHMFMSIAFFYHSLESA